MSPLEIHCLLEIYAYGDPKEDGHSQHPMAIDALSIGGLIHEVPSKKANNWDWKVTEKGREHVESLCGLPFPEQKTEWIRPYKVRLTADELGKILNA